MTQYRLTDQELTDIIKASQPVPYLVIGGHPPSSPRDNAMAVWSRVAKRVNCHVNTIDSANTGDDHDFIAQPLEETV